MTEFKFNKVPHHHLLADTLATKAHAEIRRMVQSARRAAGQLARVDTFRRQFNTTSEGGDFIEQDQRQGQERRQTQVLTVRAGSPE